MGSWKREIQQKIVKKKDKQEVYRNTGNRQQYWGFLLKIQMKK